MNNVHSIPCSCRSLEIQEIWTRMEFCGNTRRTHLFQTKGTTRAKTII